MEFPVEVRYFMGPIPIALVDARGSAIGYADCASGFPQYWTVYADEAKTTPIYKLSSDNVNSFSVEWRFERPDKTPLGSIERFGRRSVWRAYYDVRVGDGLTFTVQEANPFVKLANFFVSTAPFMQVLTGGILNPTYRLSRPGGAPGLRIRKTGPTTIDATWSTARIFTIDRDGDMSDAEQEVALLSLMVVAMNEGTRG